MSRKILIDGGVREGNSVAAFLGWERTWDDRYEDCLRPRGDAADFEIIGFEASSYLGLEATRSRFASHRFRLDERLVWIFDGTVSFDGDGDSVDSRIFEVSRTAEQPPWRHPNPAARVREEPCVDLARLILEECAGAEQLVLKLDIEGAEYDVLERLVDTGALARVTELYVEYHWWGASWLRPKIEAFLADHPAIHYRSDWP